MQPSTAGDTGGVRRVRADVQETPLNVEGWWRRGEGGVPADQVRCFSEQGQSRAALLTHVTVTGIFSAVFRAEAREGTRTRG